MSEFIAKQVEAKQKAWHEAKALIDSVEARGGVWTGEDESKYAALTAEIDRRNETIELETREAKVAEQIQASAINFKDATVSDDETDILRKMAAGELRGYEFKMEKRITGSSTGAPVPTSFYNQIVAVARLVNPLLDYATVINTASGENLQIPSQAGFSTATIVGQGVNQMVYICRMNLFSLILNQIDKVPHPLFELPLLLICLRYIFVDFVALLLAKQNHVFLQY